MALINDLEDFFEGVGDAIEDVADYLFGDDS